MGVPLQCFSKFQIISLQQRHENLLLRCEDVFTIKDCMQEDHLCVFILIEDSEEPRLRGAREQHITQSRQKLVSVIFTDEFRFTLDSDYG
ncbi:hypothetical protein AVEN_265168-1 [Araneus ventricosus]|uniref:Uncharacterized protein n=1 Tax=Araneus ventricosus TaxID=182803 RepID=A0A4Y2CQB5_ARAVE|nr:hypothetical protein AVEN_265168-1 [Araneus ventricosus]